MKVLYKFRLTNLNINICILSNFILYTIKDDTVKYLELYLIRT